MSSLPPLLTIRGKESTEEDSLELPFQPVLTKAEKYKELSKFDRLRLRRQEAHFRNALKTTSGLESVARDLNKNLSQLEEKKGRKTISFDRLAVCREAFERIIKLNKECAPELKHIMDVYNEYVLYMVSKTHSMPRPPHWKDSLGHDSDGAPKDSIELDRLKHKLHQLEVKVRVSLREQADLEKKLKETTAFHSQEVRRLHMKGEEKVSTASAMIAEKDISTEYLAHLERLHLQIADKQDKIAEEKDKRKGSVPMSVYHNIEQCLREAEIDMQKTQRKNQILRIKLKNCEEELLYHLQQHDLQINGDLREILGFS